MLIFKTGSFIGLELLDFGGLVRQTSLSLPLQSWDSKHVPFYMGSGVKLSMLLTELHPRHIAFFPLKIELWLCCPGLPVTSVWARTILQPQPLLPEWLRPQMCSLCPTHSSFHSLHSFEHLVGVR